MRTKLNPVLVGVALLAMTAGLAAQDSRLVVRDHLAQETSAASAASTGMPQLVDMLRPGDLVQIAVFMSAEFSGTQRVEADGTILLPMVGRLPVAGMTTEQARLAVQKALMNAELLRDPQVSVAVLESVGAGITLAGEFKHTGTFPFVPNQRVQSYLDKADGLNQSAALQVKLYHRDQPDAPELLTLGSGRAEDNPVLRPGDRLVATRLGVIYVVGEVMRPGGYVLDRSDPTTVVKAIGMAQGPKQDAKTNRTILIRMVNGKRETQELVLNRMMKAQDPDVELKDGDIVYVPHSVGRMVLRRGIEDAIALASSIVVYNRF